VGSIGVVVMSLVEGRSSRPRHGRRVEGGQSRSQVREASAPVAAPAVVVVRLDPERYLFGEGGELAGQFDLLDDDFGPGLGCGGPAEGCLVAD
jgi:hypothetical protein